MRMAQLNLTTVPTKAYERDDKRGIYMCRNTHATQFIFVQFGKPGALEDFFKILPGDTLTLDRGDLSQEIWMYSNALGTTNQMAVG